MSTEIGTIDISKFHEIMPKNIQGKLENLILFMYKIPW